LTQAFVAAVALNLHCQGFLKYSRRSFNISRRGRFGSVAFAIVESERAETLQSARVAQPPQSMASQDLGDLPVAAEV